MEPSRDKLVGVVAAATIAGRSTTTIYDWLSAGRLTRHYEDGVIKVSTVELMTVPAPLRGRPPRSMAEPSGMTSTG